MGTIAKHGFHNVIDAIVDKDLCIGCGICAGICPPTVLDMDFNQYGEFIPLEVRTGCLEKCTLCVINCPFWSQEENEDTLGASLYGASPAIDHRPEAGYFLDTFVGYSNVSGQRLAGASGGLTTWFLQKLLRDQHVDRVICVGAATADNRLFEFQIFDSPDDVQKAASSAYYPVEMSEVIQEILRTDARYAITGLPCALKGLRLAMRKNRRLRHRIVVQIGLVCGQTKSTFYADYLAALAGAEVANLQTLRFREKSPDRPVWNHGVKAEWRQDDQLKSNTVTWVEGAGQAWTLDYFKPNACSYCDDIFAELADVVFMDAWLPGYRDNPYGDNLVINRAAFLQPFWEEALNSDEVSLQRIDIEQVIQSQAPVVRNKRKWLAHRLYEAARTGTPVPAKRVPPAPLTSLSERWAFHWPQKMRTVSREKFAALGRNFTQSEFETFLREMDRALLPHRIVTAIRRRAKRIAGRLRS